MNEMASTGGHGLLLRSLLIRMQLNREPTEAQLNAMVEAEYARMTGHRNVLDAALAALTDHPGGTDT